MKPGDNDMIRIRWTEIVGWLLGGAFLGALVGAAMVPLSEQAGRSSTDFLTAVGLGALLGVLGAVVVLGTKASMPRATKRLIHGVVFATHGTDDTWYYQDTEGGSHGPFNRSMMNDLVAAGANVVTNMYPEVTHVAPALPKTRISRPNVLQLDRLGFGEETHIISRAS